MAVHLRSRGDPLVVTRDHHEATDGDDNIMAARDRIETR